ncbi:hypothetical protein HKD37_18G050667 [Glycine soja]
MWYHSPGNILSVSTRHSYLGKLGSMCRGHPIVHRQLPPGDQPEPQGSSKPSDMPPSTSIFPH